MTCTLRQAAESTAIEAFAFLARQPQRIEGFLAASGMAPGALRAVADDPIFLRGVLEHLLADEAMLLVFCEEAGCASRDVWAAWRALGGAPANWE